MFKPQWIKTANCNNISFGVHVISQCGCTSNFCNFVSTILSLNRQCFIWFIYYLYDHSCTSCADMKKYSLSIICIGQRDISCSWVFLFMLIHVVVIRIYSCSNIDNDIHCTHVLDAYSDTCTRIMEAATQKSTTMDIHWPLVATTGETRSPGNVRVSCLISRFHNAMPTKRQASTHHDLDLHKDIHVLQYSEKNNSFFIHVKILAVGSKESRMFSDSMEYYFLPKGIDHFAHILPISAEAGNQCGRHLSICWRVRLMG